MLTGGRNATTTGAVESDQFIEDDKPSIYDTMSDMFDGPKKIRKQNNRAVDPRTSAKHLEKVIKSEQSGKSFRTFRERPLPQKLDLKDKITNALFFVEGSVPARFSLDCYHHFDGWDWSKIDLDSEFMPKSTITVRNSMGKPWYRVNNVQREYLSQKRGHRVKIMRLSTDSLPASSLVDRWHIHRVDLPKMFRWNKQGIIRMDGDCIPSHTMIDVVSNVPNYHVLRSVKSLQRVDHPGETWTSIDIWLGVGSESGSSNDKFSVGDTDPDSPLLQIPENESKTKLGELVKNLTFGHREGWNQVEAIVNHFRNNYKHDPQLVASDEGIDSVKSFLKNGGGPSYLFASTTAQALRSAGYRTRLVSGFLVENDDFDRRANQSIVTKENLHMWPEVCLDGWHWLPVEPTPGFPIPYSHQTMWQIVKSNVIALIKLMVRHPIQTILLTGLLSLCLRYRREVTVLGSWLMWMAILLAFPGRRLTATRQMLDVRFWAAGIPRPSFATISDWSFHVNAGADNEFFEYWKFVNFSNRPTNDKRKEIKLACRKVSEDLSFEKIKQFAKQFAKAGSKSC